MGDYLVVIRTSEAPSAIARYKTLRARAVAAGMVIDDLRPNAWIGRLGPSLPPLRPIGGWLLIGDVMDRRRPVLPSSAADDPWDYERRLLCRVWGRFVGLRFGADGHLDAILRDPSGALDCVAWTQDELITVSSSAPDWLIAETQPRWTINVARVAAALRSPQLTPGALLLDGPTAVEPGSLQPLPLEAGPVPLWEATAFAHKSLTFCSDVETSAMRLKDAIEEAVWGLARLPGAVAAEVSGGLDSSLVAASLVAAPDLKIEPWLNAYGVTPESDERRWVDALAGQLGITPVRAAHVTAPLTAEGFEETNRGFRPGLAALDVAHDLEWSRRLEAAGAVALMTGKGGDSVLMQGVGGDVFTDLWLQRGVSALLSHEARALALASEKSLWSLRREALRFKAHGAPPPERDDGLLRAPEETPAMISWRRHAAAFGPAKAGQLAGVRDNISRHGPTMLTRSVDLRHPLCAQPVVETCLATPSWILTLGGRDRGLARHAFRDRLPAAILERRSKGDMSRLYGMVILDNLDFLRGWLIHGRLADLGVIDPAAADRLLTRETLIWRGRYAAILTAAAFEGWVRSWERRLPPS